MRCQTIPAGNPGPYTGQGNNTYLLTGRVPVLIDAGIGLPDHVEAVEAALQGAALAAVMVTHGHLDHASGAPALSARWPDVRLMKLPVDTDAASAVAWHPFAAGETVPAGDGALRVVATPGHAPDHVCLLDEEAREIFTGDLLVQGNTVLIPASRGGDLTLYLESLQRLIDLDPVRAWPGHGPPIDRPATLARHYMTHRREREYQVLDVLSRGAQTPQAIVDVVYRGLAAELTAAARETVLAHLVKLAREQKVLEEQGRWKLA